MASRDVIQLALSGPLDWEQFEGVVAEVLRDDDLPSIRRLGGGSDKGLDGVQEAFYEGVSVVDCAIQVTSQKAQKLKVANTLQKLKKYSITPRKLIVVFRDECSSPTRAAIKKQALSAGIEVDVRDQSYLVGELGRIGSSIFVRHFESDLRSQVDHLMGRADPLAIAPDHLKQSVLASFAAFSFGRDGQALARGRLFEQSVLTAIASADGLDLAGIEEQLERLIPEYQSDKSQLSAALSRLKERGDIIEEKGKYKGTDRTLARIALAAKHVKDGFEALFDYVRESVGEVKKLNDAELGYLERNCKKAIAQLVRLMGPNGKNIPKDSDSHKWLTSLLGRNLSGEVGRRALFALTEFVSDSEGQKLIAPLARAYSIVAIRNLDPLGRKWQSSVLQRSTTVLDTDAVLGLLVEELPHHRASLNAVKAFKGAGVSIVIPRRIFAEVVLHVQSATRVYNRVGGDALVRLTESAAASTIWNAVTRGFWYARGNRHGLSWDTYLQGYLDDEKPLEYLRHILETRLPGVRIEDFDGISDKDHVLLHELIQGPLHDREQHRLKSQFRDQKELAERLEADLKILLKLSDVASNPVGHGYLISEDGSFWIAEESPYWSPRPRVAVRTRLLPELAELCCGTILHDEEIVGLMFEPATLAAGELLKEEVEVLASVGADLRNTSLLRLEWELKSGLTKKIHAFEAAQAESDESKIQEAAVDLLETAGERLKLDPAIARLATDFRRIQNEGGRDKAELERLKTSLRDLLFEVAGDSSKGRARARRAMRDLGVEGE